MTALCSCNDRPNPLITDANTGDSEQDGKEQGCHTLQPLMAIRMIIIGFPVCDLHPDHHNNRTKNI